MSEEKRTDELTVGPEVEGGGRMFARCNENGVSVGTMSVAEDGKPLSEGSELVRLTHIENNRYQVEHLYSHGPAKVASEEYRNGWDRIFGKKEVAQA